MNEAMSTKNLVLVLAGGIGNQLFMYAAALRLAEHNGANLLVDIDSRLSNEMQRGTYDSYQQCFQLDKFNVSLNIAPPELQYNRRWSRIKRNIYLKINKWLSFDKRWIVLEEADKDGMLSFDPRLLDLRLRHENTYTLDCFQCEQYFTDIRDQLLSLYKVRPPFNGQTEAIASKIKSMRNPVAVHARQLRTLPYVKEDRNLTKHKQKPFSYYDQAIEYLMQQIGDAHFFCFGDDPAWLEMHWSFDYPATFVSHKDSESEATQDFYLMSLCRHFIVGNSTFSWWPAWLSQAEDKIVVAPENKNPDLWSGNRNIVPDDWMVI